MKKIYLFLILFLTARMGYGQGNYSFSHTTGTYQEISGGTTLFPTGFFDTLALGFNFTLDGKTNDTLKLRVKGTLSADNISTIQERIFEPFGGEHSRGQYSYTIDGSAGNRIVRIQYKNVKFDHDMTGNDFINFQVWLYEADNTVEVHYGSSNIQNPVWDYYYNETGPYIGFNGFLLSGNVANPVVATTAARVTGTPPDGMIYRFQPAPNNIPVYNTLTKKNELSVFPNPATSILYVSGTAHADLSVTDMTGRLLLNTEILENGKGIDISVLPAGVYVLRSGNRYCRFTKQ